MTYIILHDDGCGELHPIPSMECSLFRSVQELQDGVYHAVEILEDFTGVITSNYTERIEFAIDDIVIFKLVDEIEGIPRKEFIRNSLLPEEEEFEKIEYQEYLRLKKKFEDT